MTPTPDGRGPGQVKPPRSVRPPAGPPGPPMTDAERWCVDLTDAVDAVIAVLRRSDRVVMRRVTTAIQAAADVAIADKWPHTEMTVREFIEARR